VTHGDDVTGHLQRWREGDPAAPGAAFEAAYEQLRSLAHQRLRHEHPGHTLNTTALVHEAYLRLAAAGDVNWQDRAHFFAVASRAMRRILVDHARERGARKRGGDLVRIQLEPEQLAGLLATEEIDPEALLALDHHLTELGQSSPRAAQAVELRYFGGLTLAEVGETLGISPPTAMRDVRYALAWLARAFSR
jgi:RNA polymerase sigma factor (TIGR02999 family)